MVLGVVGMVSADPLPMVLLPGYEYHISEWVEEDGTCHWVLERRVAGTPRSAWRPVAAAPQM